MASIIVNTVELDGDSISRGTIVARIMGKSVDLVDPVQFSFFMGDDKLYIDDANNIKVFYSFSRGEIEGHQYRIKAVDSKGTETVTGYLYVTFKPQSRPPLTVTYYRANYQTNVIPAGSIILGNIQYYNADRVTYGLRVNQNNAYYIDWSSRTLRNTYAITVPKEQGLLPMFQLEIIDYDDTSRIWLSNIHWPDAVPGESIQIPLNATAKEYCFENVQLPSGSIVLSNIQLINSNQPAAYHKISLTEGAHILSVSGTNIRTISSLAPGTFYYTIKVEDGTNIPFTKRYKVCFNSPLITPDVKYDKSKFLSTVNVGDVVISDIRCAAASSGLGIEIIEGGDYYQLDQYQRIVAKVQMNKTTKKGVKFKVNISRQNYGTYTSPLEYPEFNQLPPMQCVLTPIMCPNPAPAGTVVTTGAIVLNLSDYQQPLKYELIKGAENYAITNIGAVQSRTVISSIIAPEFQVRISTSNTPPITWTSVVMKPQFDQDLPKLQVQYQLDQIPYYCIAGTVIGRITSISGGMEPYTYSFYIGEGIYHIDNNRQIIASVNLSGDNPVQFSFKVQDSNVSTTSIPYISPTLTPNFGSKPQKINIDTSIQMHKIEYEYIPDDAHPICTITVNNAIQIGSYSIQISYPYNAYYYIKNMKVYSFFPLSGSDKKLFRIQISPDSSNLVNSYISDALYPDFKDRPDIPDPTPDPGVEDDFQDLFDVNYGIYRITRNIKPTKTIIIPYGSTLDFQGGKISGKIKIDKAYMHPTGLCVQDYVDSVEGTFGDGQIVYNKSMKRMELWNGSSWVNVDGTPLAQLRINIV